MHDNITPVPVIAVANILVSNFAVFYHIKQHDLLSCDLRNMNLSRTKSLTS